VRGSGRRETDVWTRSSTPRGTPAVSLHEFHDRPWTSSAPDVLPVSTYIGGNEHAVLHLLYSRFVTMALPGARARAFRRAFPKLRAHGLIIKERREDVQVAWQRRHSDAYIQKWGADTFRITSLFLGPFQEGGDFRETGIIGIRRFLDKVWQLAHEALTPGSALPPEVERKLHQTIRKVTVDTETSTTNTAIAAMMEYVNLVRERGAGGRHAIEPLLLMLAPYAPHLAEELWVALGHERSIFTATWPTYDERLARRGRRGRSCAGEWQGARPARRLGAAPARLRSFALAMQDEAVKKFR